MLTLLFGLPITIIAQQKLRPNHSNRPRLHARLHPEPTALLICFHLMDSNKQIKRSRIGRPNLRSDESAQTVETNGASNLSFA